MSHSPAGWARNALLVIAALSCAACASTATRTPGDPIEPANRSIYKFNDAIDRGVLKPTAKVYDKHSPGWLKTGIGNFFENLTYPGTIVNQLLQGKVKAAGQDTARFLMNLTLGWGGVMDVASGAKLPHHDEDLGQTLGLWGVPPGPYVMMPFFGPASLRDLPSAIMDRFIEPLSWYNYGNERWFAFALDAVDTRARLLPLDASLDQVYDRYAFIRNAYLQRRLYLVYDGNPPEEALEDEELEDPDPGADAEPESTQPASGEQAAPSAPEQPSETTEQPSDTTQ
jgi:phospholipid-binding lipoprotein MlaA